MYPLFAMALVAEVSKNHTIEQRVGLRKLHEADAAAFYAIVGDPEVMTHLSWEQHARVEESAAFLKKMEQHPRFYAICLDDEVVGFIILTPKNGNVELGYALAKAHWGKGIATVAVKRVLKIGRKNPGMHRIEAFVDKENIASQKVLLKSGMQCEALLENNVLIKGKMRDQYKYVMRSDS